MPHNTLFFLIYITFIFLQNISNNPPPPPPLPPYPLHNNYPPSSYSHQDNFNVLPPNKRNDFHHDRNNNQNKERNGRFKDNMDINKKIYINNMMNTIKDLKEKTKYIVKQNDDSKNKLKKYILFYNIIAFLNIIFSFILVFYIIYKISPYFISKKKRNNLSFSLNNNISPKINENIKDSSQQKVIITTTSFIIEAVNNNIFKESFDKNGNVAPPVKNIIKL